MSVRYAVHGRGDVFVNITHDALDLSIQGTPDLFKLVHLRTPPSVLTSGGY